MAMRAIAGLQDAVTFQEARDILLRFYYSILRTARKDDLNSELSLQETEDWTMELLHSGSQTSAALFFDKVVRKKGPADVATAENFQKVIDAARKNTNATPYERVGHVLAWLKETRKTHSELEWGHGSLRQWMQGLLTDFTLADAKTKPGALLGNPEVHYKRMLASWNAEKSGLPFESIWDLKSRRWFLKNVAGGISNMDENSWRSTELTFHLREKLSKESDPAMILMTHPSLGVTRRFQPTWRDVTDYGVLHPLLTLEESSFDKNVWLDFIQHQGQKWGSKANEDTWHAWQENAQTSYQQVLQAYAGSTPRAVVSWSDSVGSNPLQAKAVSPLPLDWYVVLSELSLRFPYLNQSPELEAMAKLKLNPTEQVQFKIESNKRVGQPLILALIELPEALKNLNALNMPAWFHARLQEEMHKPTQFDLPEGLLDDDQAPSLY